MSTLQCQDLKGKKINRQKCSLFFLPYFQKKRHNSVKKILKNVVVTSGSGKCAMFGFLEQSERRLVERTVKTLVGCDNEANALRGRILLLSQVNLNNSQSKV